MHLHSVQPLVSIICVCVWGGGEGKLIVSKKATQIHMHPPSKYSLQSRDILSLVALVVLYRLI